MAYEVTATRRRPQRFEDMVGQEFVVATLQKSIAAGKIAHAYLFSGPRGCGKTSSARILAKALNCEKGPSGTPCGICPACSEITRGSSLDVIEIDGASNTSVNDVRQIKEEVQFPPNSCRYKVYIIDEVHMLSTSAFNALLKTIEEPPPYVVFIFATTELHKVPATIKSRCQQFNFRLVSVEILKDVLGEAARESGLAAEDEALFWIAREATGSVRDAYTLFDQVAAFSDGEITFEKIRDKLGLIGVDRLNPIFESCVSGDGKAALLLLDELLQNGVSVEQCTVDLADFLRNLLLIKSGIEKESLLGQRADRFSDVVLRVWTSAQIERALSIVLQLFRDIRYSLDPRYELELCIAKIAGISEYVSISELKTVLQNARSLFSGTIKADRNPFDQAVCEDATFKQAANNSKHESLSTGIGGDKSEPERIADPFADFKKKIGAANFSNRNEQKEPLPGEPLTWLAVEKSSGTCNTDQHEASEADTPKDANPSVELIKFEQLKQSLVSYFQSSKNMIAAALEQSFNWKEEESGYSFSVDKPFSHSFLEQEVLTINSVASRLLGRDVSGRILLDTSRADTENNVKAVPERIEMVRRLFRGTLV